MYGRGEYAAQAHHAIAGRFPAIHRILLNKRYIDDLYQWAIDRVALAVRLAGLRLRLTQTGLLQNYGAAMAAGAVVIALAWWVLLV